MKVKEVKIQSWYDFEIINKATAIMEDGQVRELEWYDKETRMFASDFIGKTWSDVLNTLSERVAQ